MRFFIPRYEACANSLSMTFGDFFLVAATGVPSGSTTNPEFGMTITPGGAYPLLMESTWFFCWARVGTVDLGNLCNIEGRNRSERSPGASYGKRGWLHQWVCPRSPNPLGMVSRCLPRSFDSKGSFAPHVVCCFFRHSGILSSAQIPGTGGGHCHVGKLWAKLRHMAKGHPLESLVLVPDVFILTRGSPKTEGVPSGKLT